MAMEYDGKTYRNLQEQVGYLTGKWDDLQDQINDVRAHLTHYVVVDTLPTGDDIDPSAVYLLGPMGTAPDQYYEEWVYVQKADESWVWEKLGDTDSVDLSGYLEKQTGTTGNAQAYVKNPDGTQVMVDIAQNNAGASTLVRRTGSGQVVATTPTDDTHATTKKYVDDGFLSKRTEVSSNQKAYMKYADGSQGMIDISPYRQAEALVARSATAQVYVPDTPDDGICAVNKNYADSTYLAKQTGSTSNGQLYAKTNGGSQAMVDVGSSVAGNMVVARTGTGQILVPATPTDNTHAASKAYVDAAVGQLLYLHDIEIIVTVDASNKLYIKAFLVNGSGTAVASIDTTTFKRMDVQYGCFGPDVATGTPCAVTKKPDSFVYDDFAQPRQSYLYQYISGGSLISGETTNSMTVTFTDTVVSF